MTPKPLSAEEEALPLRTEEEERVRAWATSLGVATFGRAIAAYGIVPRLLATLDAARSTPPLDEAVLADQPYRTHACPVCGDVHLPPITASRAQT